VISTIICYPPLAEEDALPAGDGSSAGGIFQDKLFS